MKNTEKNLIRLVLGLVLWSGALQAQTVRVVDNTANAPDGVNVYATLEEAHDAADPGDIVHMIGSTVAYAGTTIDKPLSIYGIGIDPQKDVPNETIINSEIILMTDASGTLIEGLRFTSHLRLYNTVSNVAVRKCYFVPGQILQQHNQSKTNILVESCVIQGSSINLGWVGNQNIMIRNNILLGTTIQVSNAQITNNVFAHNSQFTVFGGGSNANANLRITNNVFFKARPVFSSVANSIYNNNLAFGSLDDTLPEIGIPVGSNTGDGNITEVIPDAIVISPVNFFVNFPEVGSSVWSPDFDFTLHLDNPGVGQGNDGTDMGAFGGNTPFDMLVDLPIIELLNTEAYINEGVDLSVSVDASAN